MWTAWGEIKSQSSSTLHHIPGNPITFNLPQPILIQWNLQRDTTKRLQPRMPMARQMGRPPVRAMSSNELDGPWAIVILGPPSCGKVRVRHASGRECRERSCMQSEKCTNLLICAIFSKTIFVLRLSIQFFIKVSCRSRTHPYPLSLVLSLPLQLNRSLHDGGPLSARCQHTDVLSATSCPVFQGTQCELLVQKYVGPFPFSVNGSVYGVLNAYEQSRNSTHNAFRPRFNSAMFISTVMFTCALVFTDAYGARYGLVHISTGDLLRVRQRDLTALGEIMDEGRLVPVRPNFQSTILSCL